MNSMFQDWVLRWGDLNTLFTLGVGVVGFKAFSILGVGVAVFKTFSTTDLGVVDFKTFWV